MEDKPIEEICNYKLENVFKNERDANERFRQYYYLTFNEYLHIMLNKIIKHNISDMSKRSKEVLVMDQLHFKYVKGKNVPKKPAPI